MFSKNLACFLLGINEQNEDNIARLWVTRMQWPFMISFMQPAWNGSSSTLDECVNEGATALLPVTLNVLQYLPHASSVLKSYFIYELFDSHENSVNKQARYIFIIHVWQARGLISTKALSGPRTYTWKWTGWVSILDLSGVWSHADSPVSSQDVREEYFYYYNWDFFHRLSIFLPCMLISIWWNRRNVQLKWVHLILVPDLSICIWWVSLTSSSWTFRASGHGWPCNTLLSWLPDYHMLLFLLLHDPGFWTSGFLSESFSFTCKSLGSHFYLYTLSLFSVFYPSWLINI